MPLKVLIEGEKAPGHTWVHKKKSNRGEKQKKNHIEIPHGIKWIMIDGHVDFEGR